MINVYHVIIALFIDKFQQYLQKLILVNSQMENVNPNDIFKEIRVIRFGISIRHIICLCCNQRYGMNYTEINDR
jgi:hypothetical protein